MSASPDTSGATLDEILSLSVDTAARGADFTATGFMTAGAIAARGPASGAMPDAADASAPTAGALAWVGMAGIALPLVLPDADGQALRVPATVDAHVDLTDDSARGIHMSRLFLLVERALAGAALAPAMLRDAVRGFADSQPGLSTRARLRVRYEQLVRRPALVSAHQGWRAYPVTVTATGDGDATTIELAVRVTYSSTCPSSAALARQVVAAQFQREFAATPAVDAARVATWLAGEGGMPATPHAQRSFADVRIRLHRDMTALPVVALIDAIEDALQTPVQAVVKREDEQAFAQRNGANLMFCEDAARRIAAALRHDARVVAAIADFHVRATHGESLHAHDAVAVAVKGVAGGYVASPD